MIAGQHAGSQWQWPAERAAALDCLTKGLMAAAWAVAFSERKISSARAPAQDGIHGSL